MALRLLLCIKVHTKLSASVYVNIIFSICILFILALIALLFYDKWIDSDTDRDMVLVLLLWFFLKRTWPIK